MLPVAIGPRTFAGPGPFVMGVLNVTPDSFSDGGRHAGVERALAWAERLRADGADLLDVGGESTRPGAPAVSAQEEIDRVVPVVERLARGGYPLPISVDTWKAEVARAALAAGAHLVNDIQGLADPAMARAVAEAGAPVVAMHMRGTPADMQSRAVYGDVVTEVRAELEAVLARALAAGIPRERVILDPGLGFAKTAAHNLLLLRELPRLRIEGCALLVGPSRKSFIGHVTGAPVEARLPGTLAAVAAAVLAGAELVRVHDVAEARQAAQVAAAIRDASQSPDAR
ncbi:dihydropteroate synthase [Anaeromyxobacter paludicola]|uniref:Dihydropteroate synthase n=1 Tax=Anaeromyxobacter paludicola TaxID=2918171 RepID=A0ABM7X7N9_9BACT|nr:dihydropteroate synthase [Anaeromyxobacter paludicola]BDG07853.1 dihydropteroate synthase [Anaeromyxobacter paludicola]